MKRNRKHWLFVLLLILGGQISAQENKDSLFAPFAVCMDVDKESFLIGTLDDYIGHQQTFTAGSDTCSFWIRELEKTNNSDHLQQAKESAGYHYQLVDSYYPREKNLALWIQTLFGDEYSDLYMIDTGHDGKGIRLYSASLTEIINHYYDYKLSGSNMTVFSDTVYSGSLKSERLQTVRQKLSFLAGAFLRDGYQSESKGYYLSMSNSRSKAKLCSKLLSEFDCTNVVHEVLKDHVPCGNIICFEPSETIGKLIEKVKAMKENLESDEATKKYDLTVDTSIPVTEMHTVNRHLPKTEDSVCKTNMENIFKVHFLKIKYECVQYIHEESRKERSFIYSLSKDMWDYYLGLIRGFPPDIEDQKDSISKVNSEEAVNVKPSGAFTVPFRGDCKPAVAVRVKYIS
ncbi:MAG: hypothetical protein LBK97_01425 [Prevotellaceae bacterium]|nr:hypothetical protein [Prevotellaceae bacterium]